MRLVLVTLGRSAVALALGGLVVACPTPQSPKGPPPEYEEPRRSFVARRRHAGPEHAMRALTRPRTLPPDMDLDLEQLRHMAVLAELSLGEEEERRLAVEIGRIVAYVAELDAIDTTDVPPTAHVAGIEPAASEEGWREDVVKPGLSHEEALAGRPARRARGLRRSGLRRVRYAR